MSAQSNSAFQQPNKVKISQPAANPQENEQLWEELKKYARLVPFEPDPNLGRVKEIMEEIKKGTYPSKEILDATAARLTYRLSQKSDHFSQ